MAIRCDLGTLQPATELPDGRLIADAYITRAGVFEYQEPDGSIRRELRPEEEVFDPESMASFEQVPMTDDHPSVGLLDSDNAKRFMVGSTGETVTREDDHLKVRIMVADSSVIKAMRPRSKGGRGKNQLSCGYKCDVEEKPGVHPKWGRYDAIQRNIRGNHLAIVSSARAGASAHVRMDGASVQMPSTNSGEINMAQDEETVRALGAQLKTAEERADKAESEAKTQKLRADTNEGRLMQMDAEVKELTSKLAGHVAATETDAYKQEKSRADSLEEKVAKFDSTFEEAVRNRSKLVVEAQSVLGHGFRCDDLNDRQIRTAVVTRLDSTADVGKGIEEGIVIGRYETLIAGFNKNARSQARIAEILDTKARVDSVVDTNQKIRDQWKAPLPNDIRAKKD